ncbi:MAG: SemiSWEET transporter [Pyrinomonadaceae bacterium]
MNWTKILGLIAGFCTTLAVAPQIYKTWKKKDVEDISLRMFIVLCTGLLLWTIYGILQRDLPIILANGISFSLNSLMLFFYFKFKK